MRDLTAFEIARLHRKHAQVDRRLGLVDLGGKVKPGSQDMDKRTVVLILGKTADGKDVEGPPIRWQATGAGALKMHATPADNEQMTMHSPSGTIGSGSLAHWGTYDQDHPPPSTSKDEAVLQFGDGSITIGKDNLKISYGSDVYVELTKTDAIVRVGSGGTVKLGKEAETGELLPVKLVAGEADSVKAKVG